MNTLYRCCILIALVLTVAACGPDGNDIRELPTAARPEDVATAVVLTRNAPPRGFNSNVDFSSIDEGLPVLPSWQYDLLLRFEGQFAGTTRPISGETSAQVFYNQTGLRRRVIVDRAGDLLADEQNVDVTIEGVRTGQNTYLVLDDTCLTEANNTEQAATVADLRASELIGGVRNATPIGAPETINGERVWRYEFSLDDLEPPAQLEFVAGGGVVAFSGELWISPEREAVVRYHVNMEVENALIFGSDAPLNGQIIIRYDVYNVGVDPNITRPFGC